MMADHISDVTPAGSGDEGMSVTHDAELVAGPGAKPPHALPSVPPPPAQTEVSAPSSSASMECSSGSMECTTDRPSLVSSPTLEPDAILLSPTLEPDAILLLQLEPEILVLILEQVESLRDLARMDCVSHAFHSPPESMPTLLQRPLPVVQQALGLRAEAGGLAVLAEEASWAHLRDRDGEEAAVKIRAAARVCAAHEQHDVAAGMLMLAAQRAPDAASTQLVQGVLARSGYRPKVHGGPAHRDEIFAFGAMSVLLGSGQARAYPWPLTLRALVERCGAQNSANLIAVAHGLHVGLVQARGRLSPPPLSSDAPTILRNAFLSDSTTPTSSRTFSTSSAVRTASTASTAGTSLPPPPLPPLAGAAL